MEETIALRVEYRIMVNDPNVISRCVENEDGWRDNFYNLPTKRAVMEHLAFNLGLRERRLSQLEGWADLPDDAVTVGEGAIDIDDFQSEEPK